MIKLQAINYSALYFFMPSGLLTVNKTENKIGYTYIYSRSEVLNCANLKRLTSNALHVFDYENNWNYRA